MTRERYHLSIAVFVLLRKGDQVCLLRRSNTGWMDGFYSLPAGGLEQGETLAQAAVREAREEVGVIISPDQLALSHTLHVQTEDRSWIGHFFSCTEWSETPFLAEPDKHSDLCWKNINALPSETIPYVKQAINHIACHKQYSEYGW